MSAPRPMLGLALPLRVWLTLSHFAMLALPIVAILATGALATDLRDQTRADLQHQGQVLATVLTDRMHRRGETLYDAEGLSPLLTTIREQTLAGIRVVDAEGVVVATSGSQLGETLAGRPEVDAALEGAIAESVRPRPPLSSKHSLDSEARFADVRIFVAVPVVENGHPVGAVVLSRTPREELQAIYQMAPRLIWGAGVGLFLTFLPTMLYGYLFSRSLRRVSRTANRMASGSVANLRELDLPDRSHVVEAREISAAFRTMAERLQERLSYFSEFAGNVAHEFKTPLASLKGTIELLEDPDMPPAQRARFLGNAAEDVDRLDRLVGGLLSLARAEEGMGQEPIALDELAAEVLVRHPAVTVEGAGSWVRGNREQLASALDNLLENAARHGKAPIALRLWTEPERTGFDVTDAGEGVSEGNVDKVFARFFTTHRGEGTGLGLALVRAIARVHGGEVELLRRAEPTTFRVSLPRA
ncbi:MAG: HAMP domain-containing protein [Deltaproteobacteria bacterium]|nr:MAG: HAMP domain-containing protein [Deltaproteobacteria bacterium]